jgi:excinuclease ABC subunit C
VKGEPKRERCARLAREAGKLPAKPGVYLFHDAASRVIYVGKAKSLRSRVRSYFGKSADLSAKVLKTAEATHEIEFIVTRTEMEALLLEYNLIKEHHPRYNVVYRDDKKYPYLRVTLGETFPRVFPTRRIEPDGSRYFGPYADVGAMRSTLRILRNVLPLPTCTMRLTEGMSERGCLDYFLGRCVAPCRGEVDPEDYRRIVEEAMLFLNGKKDDVIATLEREMKAASRELRFEEAAKLRDRLASLRKTVAKQHVTLEGARDLDAVGMSRLARKAIGVCIQVREGRVVGRDRLEIACNPNVLESEMLRACLLGFYESRETIPPSVLVAVWPDDGELLETWLSEKAGKSVELKVASRGEAARLLEMASHNAEVALAGDHEIRGAARGELQELAEALGLARSLQRIEGFDVSNIQGTDAYASMVVFEEGTPAKSEYRTFRIRDAPRRDDPRSIEEALRRRARRILSGGRAPDLVLIDGGETQLQAGGRALGEAGLGEIPVVSLAKREELVHFPNRAEPLRLPESSAALKLLQRVRDEAHRFALRAHRLRRGGRLTASILDEIPGIGPAKKKLLIQRYGSVEGIRRASLDELGSLPGIGRSLALALWTHLGGAEES